MAKRDKNGKWLKGISANPKGRPPKGYSITEWFKEMLKSNPEVKNKIGNAIISKALSGDVTAQKLVWGYMDGQPQQDIKATGEIKISFHDSLRQDE